MKNNKSDYITHSGANSEKVRKQALAYLKAELGLDDEQVQGFLKTLSVPLKTTLEAVNKACEAKNLTAIVETAHSLKGALLNLGLNELADLASRIEATAATGENMAHESDLFYLHDALQLI